MRQFNKGLVIHSAKLALTHSSPSYLLTGQNRRQAFPCIFSNISGRKWVREGKEWANEEHMIILTIYLVGSDIISASA
jgi:hypothetical protein